MLVRRIAGALRDLAPIVFVIAFFQIVVLQQPFPNLGSIVIGLLCVIAGLTLFIQGLESGLFPLGEAIAQGFARKVIAENRAVERVNVYEIMSKPVLSLPSEMQACYAVRLLVRFGVSRAVVVDHDRNPVGIATLRDLVLGHVQE